MIRLAFAACVALGIFGVCGCALVDPPAEIPKIDDFRVTLSLLSNSCGYGALPIQATSQTDAVLRGYAGDSASWKWAGQGTAASGSSTSDGHYVFSQSSTTELAAADPTTAYPGCTVTQRTEVSFTIAPIPAQPVDAGTALDAGDPSDASVAADSGTDAGTAYVLAGQMRIDVTPNAGSNCAPLLGANGGTWQAIPCQGIVQLAGVPVP